MPYLWQNYKLKLRLGPKSVFWIGEGKMRILMMSAMKTIPFQLRMRRFLYPNQRPNHEPTLSWFFFFLITSKVSLAMEPLLTTKLFIPPQRPELVPRLRLIEQLNEGLHRKLTLISAPAGFGKTTLVTDWVQAIGKATSSIATVREGASPPTAIAWLSLDKGDNDPVRFLTYFIAALNRGIRVEKSIGEGAVSMLPSPQPPPIESILTSLINEIANIPDRFVFILDDYHLIGSSQIDDALTFLLEHLPSQLHMVIATREDPHLPLARLRARNQLTEIRAADLRFTSSEAAKFLNQVMGLNLSTENIAELETRTEGWITGLQLAAISMQRRDDATSFIQSFTGSHRLVLDYLIEEVLNLQPENVQTFLLQTAILDRLTGSLCDSLTGQENSQATLEVLERANLFIVPLDDERCYFRYHHLFADLLRQRLNQTQPEQLPNLHHKASEWYEQNGFIDDAIEHALRCDDFFRVASLIETHIDAFWKRGEHTNLRRWLVGLPVELVFSKPQLCIFRALYLFTSGQQKAAERDLQAVELVLASHTDPSPETLPLDQKIHLSDTERMKLRGGVAAIRSFMGTYIQGDVTGVIQYARQALKYLPEQDLTMRIIAAIALGDAHAIKGEMVAAFQAQLEAVEIIRSAGNIFFLIVANLKLANILREQGRLQQTVEICQQQMQLASRSGLSQTDVVGWLLAMWGEALAEMNDLEGAIDLARKGVELLEHGGDVAMLSWSYLRLMRVLYSMGDIIGAEEIIQKTEQISQEREMPPWLKSLMAAWQTRIWLAKGNLDELFNGWN
jgi:LuxR family maltose regulon positive regulatory protein